MVTNYKQYWKNLPSDVQKKIEGSVKNLEFKRGDTVYKVEDHPKGLYFVEKGLVGLMLLGVSGKEHLLRFFKEGQFFGHRALFSNESYHGTTVVLEPVKLKFIPTDTVLKIMDHHPELYKILVEVLSKELRRSEIQHVMILENQILARTAQAVVYLKELHPDHPWTRQEIANFCASTVSTIIKALAELEELGHIQQEGRSIKILNRDALIALQDQGI